jgi:hypothetical protein
LLAACRLTSSARSTIAWRSASKGPETKARDQVNFVDVDRNDILQHRC